MPQDSPPSDMAFLDLQFPEFMQPTMKDQHQIDFQHLPSTDANLKSCSNPNPVVTDDEGDCMKRAFTVIKHLHMPAESCLAAGISPGKIETFRTIDSTLMTNRAARETVLRILTCPCAHSWNLLFLFVLIARQLIKSY
ncbi:hypothetical protein AK830_g85 [Neonectria ditissima]|uniref:Aflatoxin regulatory protein domain-containing protein n=1 Tax=Neonectria ditissima TaxID=78410 RepID=A0A0P7BWK9_9HYPO|nr:hypothetical protein AK830_g85 [Neonectria ditissima]